MLDAPVKGLQWLLARVRLTGIPLLDLRKRPRSRSRKRKEASHKGCSYSHPARPKREREQSSLSFVSSQLFSQSHH